jgi:undecaprenyl-diphosphatase
MPRPAAVAAVGLNSIAGLVVHVLAILAVGPLLGATRTSFRLHGPDMPDRWYLLVVVAGALAMAGLVRWGRLLYRRMSGPVRVGGSAFIAALRRPRSTAVLLAGSAGVTLCYVLALAASTRAFGVQVSVPAIFAVFLGSAAVASLAPTPGGLGAMEAGLVAGLISAGALAGPAVAVVLSYRLITYWLPIVPGAFCFHFLRRRGAI